MYLKTILLNLVKKTLKQKTGTTVGTKFAPPHSILFVAELSKSKFFEKENLNRVYGGGILRVYFSSGSMEKKN